MGGKSSIIDIRLRLRDAKRFQSDMDKSGKSTKTFGVNAKKLGRNLAGAAAGFAGMAKAKEAINTTTTLAKSTLGLHNALGLSVESSSKWAAVAQVRGIEQKALAQSFGKVAKMSEAAKNGSESAAKSFGKLGISQNELMHNDMDEMLAAAADGLAGIKDKGDQAAVAQQVFGRGWQTVVPLLRGGSKEMDEQLGLAKKYGAMFGGNSVKSLQDFIQAQRESQFAMIGLQIAFSTRVVPALTKVYAKLTKAIDGFRKLPGPVKKAVVALLAIASAAVVFSPLITAIGAVITVLKLFSLRVLIAKVQVIAWRVALIAIRVAVVAMTIATKAWAVAQWLLNRAMMMNPIGLLVIALIAVVAVFVLAYKKVGWFRRAVQAVWAFIKNNWPKVTAILGGAIRRAVQIIVAVWGKLRSATGAVVNFIKDKFWGIVNFFKRMPRQIANATKNLFNGLKESFKNAINWIIKKWNGMSFGMDAVKIAGKTVIPGVHVGTPDIPLLANGGFMPRGNYGSFITGDAGPEIQTVTPQGITVRPLTKFNAPAVAGGGGDIRVVTPVYLDGKQIAEVVNNVVRSKRARR